MNREQLQRALITAIDTENEEKTRQILLMYPQQELTGKELFLLGRAAYLLREWEIAEQLYQRAEAEEMPDWCKGANSSALALLYQKLGDAGRALPYYAKSIRYKTMATGLLQEYSNYLFNLYYLNESNDYMLNAAKGYQQIIEGIRPLAADWLPNSLHEKIRVAYITPDLGRHIVLFFSYALFRYYNKISFTVYIYTTAAPGSITEEVCGWVDRVENVAGKTAKETAQKIRHDEIDILVDLAGHTGGNMLPVFAYRPAPVQMSAIGYLGTTGVREMDYYLVDRYTMPEDVCAKAEFCEEIIRMPHSHLCYMWHDNPPLAGELPALKKGYVTFGSLNQWAKINDSVLQVWARILQMVPRSRLLLKTEALSVEYVKKIARERMQQAGIDMHRVELRSASKDYLKTYGEIDIALDSFPYPGGGTTCDALYMGVPVITLQGGRHNARFGVSLLRNAGMPELIAATRDEYVKKAVSLANDLPRIAALRNKMRQQLQASPVMDAKRYVQDMEEIYIKLYEKSLLNRQRMRQK